MYTQTVSVFVYNNMKMSQLRGQKHTHTIKKKKKIIAKLVNSNRKKALQIKSVSKHVETCSAKRLKTRSGSCNLSKIN